MLSLSKHETLRTLPDLRHAPAGAPAARVVARETAFADSVRQVPAVRRRAAGDDAAGIFAVMHVVTMQRARATRKSGGSGQCGSVCLPFMFRSLLNKQKNIHKHIY